MSNDDVSAYHARRAVECRAMARAAAAPGIAALHARLARLHAEAGVQVNQAPAENYGAGGSWWWSRRIAPDPVRAKASIAA